MFGLGIPEILFILILATLVLGPEHMPKAARALGKWSAKARSAATSLTQAVTQDEDLRGVAKDLSNIRNEINSAKAEITGIKTDIHDNLEISDLKQTLAEMPDTIAGRFPKDEPQPPADPKESSFFSKTLSQIGSAHAEKSPHPHTHAVKLTNPKLLPGDISRLVMRRRVELPKPGPLHAHACLPIKLSPPLHNRAFCRIRPLPQPKSPSKYAAKHIILPKLRKGNMNEQ